MHLLVWLKVNYYSQWSFDYKMEDRVIMRSILIPMKHWVTLKLSEEYIIYGSSRQNGPFKWGLICHHLIWNGNLPANADWYL